MWGTCGFFCGLILVCSKGLRKKWPLGLACISPASSAPHRFLAILASKIGSWHRTTLSVYIKQALFGFHSSSQDCFNKAALSGDSRERKREFGIVAAGKKYNKTKKPQACRKAVVVTFEILNGSYPCYEMDLTYPGAGSFLKARTN